MSKDSFDVNEVCSGVGKIRYNEEKKRFNVKEERSEIKNYIGKKWYVYMEGYFRSNDGRSVSIKGISCRMVAVPEWVRLMRERADMMWEDDQV